VNILETFRDPPRRYGPVPFWFLNERLEAERLKWQVRQMESRHVFGAVMHARPGLVTPYLSEEWFAAIRAILEQARECGMEMWIYDDYPWASGMAEYRVPKLHPDFRIRALDRLERTVRGPQSVEWDVRGQLPEDCAGLVGAVLTPLMGERLAGAGEDVSGSLREGVLRLEVPDGDWQLAVFFERLSWNPYGDGFGRLPVTDLMHPRAVEEFIRLTHDEYRRRFPEHLGSTITATFTDEPPAGTPGWSRVFRQEFHRRKGYDILPFLPLLWHDAGALAGKVRLDYDDVKGQLYEESFFGALEAWSEGAGIASTGHLLLEETLPLHQRFMGDYFRAMRRLHYPGIDYIFPGVIPAVVPKMTASVANLYGRERVMSECFALTGWDFTFEHMKWMTDWQLVNGVNLLVPHAFFYSITEDEPIPPVPDDLGFRWYDCPPSMFYQQPYWDYYSQYADYVRRCCWLLSQGEHDNDGLGIYYPIETVQAEIQPRKEHTNCHAFEIPGTWMTADYLWEGSSPERTDAHFRAAANGLRAAGLDFDIVDDDSIREARVAEGELVMRGCRRVRAIVLPRARWISAEVYRRILELWRSGGLVIATGSLPSRAVEGPEHDREVAEISRTIFGIAPERLERALQAGETPAVPPTLSSLWFERPGEPLAEALRDAGFGGFSSDCPDLFCQRRRVGDALVCFLFHFSPEARKDVTVELTGRGPVLWLDPLTGEAVCLAAEPADRGVRLRRGFDPYESCFIVLDPRFEEKGICVRERVQDLTLRPALEVAGPWRVTLDFGDRPEVRVRDLPRFPEPGSLAVEHFWDTLAPWEERGLEDYSGAAVYEAVFGWEGDLPDDAWLDLGEAGIAAEVWLNGQRLGVRLWRPYRFAVESHLRRGENRLRVRVANTLANSIRATYGSGRVPTGADEDRVQRYARFEPGRLRSGLIGPVRLLVAENQAGDAD